MKKIITSSLLFTAIVLSAQSQTKQFNDTFYLQPVEVKAIRANDKAPFTKTNINLKDIQKQNLGKDLPFLLEQTPSVVANSDAGNGVGYTGLRIRGTDATRINVTLNGIPYNDAESQGTFFVDLPDFSSSANSIQIQRGVGTSTNGAGAFGASINIATNELNKIMYAQINNSVGSYNTWKHTFKFGSGLLGKHFTIDARLSKISSNGYIDRAKSNLKSYFISTAWTNEKNSYRFNIFSGHEVTYQAWNGVPQDSLLTHRTYNSSGTEKTGRPYENENDDYTQNHYQFFYNHKINNNWKNNIAFFLTKGKGFYEQYKAQQDLLEYNVQPYLHNGNMITSTDLARRLWLDNNFYGTIYSLQHISDFSEFTFGGSWSKYNGNHYGNVIWTKVPNATKENFRWYNLTAHKKDFTIFTKWMHKLNNNFRSYFDLQVRSVHYNINGFRKNPEITINKTFGFLNPKIGFAYNKNHWQAYISYAIANKEPNRDDFETNATLPQSETLQDVEIGFEKKKSNYSIAANFYHMNYHNQLVLVGNINDVGAYTRINVPTSYRTGIELQGSIAIKKIITIGANVTVSKNKIKNYTDAVDDYDNGGTKNTLYKSTDISFSPNLIASGSIDIQPTKNVEISLISKYVGRQYLDNTTNINRSLNPYFVQDVRMSYELVGKIFKTTHFILQLNNIFNKKYEANGYTFSYVYGGDITTENFYFPMAPFNFMAGISVGF